MLHVVRTIFFLNKGRRGIVVEEGKAVFKVVFKVEEEEEEEEVEDGR